MNTVGISGSIVGSKTKTAMILLTETYMKMREEREAKYDF